MSDRPFNFRIDFPPELPISARVEDIVATIQAHQVVILAGETGSGKTTQIPKMCLAAGRGAQGRIACTQPRRVAALSISRRVAEEMGVTWGREVGCKIRFNDETTAATVVKFLTDGMLLAEVQSDPLLRAYDTIIIDEAHERSLNIDFLLGHLRLLRYKRPELKIVITSATIDTEAFSKAFDDAPVIQVSGRTYPVEVIYAPLDSLGSDSAEGDEPTAKAEALHYIDGALEAVERILRESPSGDLLVFLPAERDIREMCDLLEGRRFAACDVVPLFGRLSNAEQQRVFSTGQRRKIVVATNIAETSLTIPGIRFVVDAGLARISRYAAQARTRRLPIEPVSQSSADQRKGRCGRVAEGVCIRLYSEKDYNERPRFTQPEIQRANLADVILRMKAFGLGDIERFPFINMPAAKSIRAGYALLEELGAIESQKPEDRSQKPEDRSQKSEAGSQRPEAGGQKSEDGFLKSEESSTPASGIRHLTSVLTPLGRELARLPVDPTVGRMILQARSEKCLREILVIAAGLSIQDPRERPLDAREKADAAHRRFAHPDSDFLALLNIWDAYHDEFERMTQAKLRRFCHDHFLSYTRMREWRDIHAQLLDVLESRDDFKLTSAFSGLKPEQVTPDKEAFGTPAYRAIHRSILAGLLGNIAVRDDENGGYKATHDRRVALFPGSVLFAKDDPKRKSSADAPQRGAQKKDPKGPRWIMAAEIMETARLYARTCARLDPLWALDLASHLLKISHSEPFWNPEAGRVMVKQKTRLYGLELETRAVGYGKINPVAATEIFIREALVNDTITWPFDFLAHNRDVRQKIENLLTRARDSGYMNLDEAAYRFYAARLLPDQGRANPPGEPRLGGDASPYQGVSAVAELIDLVRSRKGAEPRFLMMEPDDLRDPEEIRHDAEAFPEALPLDNRALPLAYAYKPGQADDGVTLDVSVQEAETLTPAALDWAVPGHLEAKVEHYLRASPKELRRAFAPLAETARSLAAQLAQRDRLTGRREAFVEALAAQLAERFNLRITPAHWADKPLPEHLRVRVRVVDDAGREICASRELDAVRAGLEAHRRSLSTSVAREDPQVWRAARLRWEKPEQTAWKFGDVPASVQVAEQAGVPVQAFPGLVSGEGGVALRLFKTPEEAAAATRAGLERLLDFALGHELGWLQKDLKALRELGPLTATLVPVGALQADAFVCLRRWLCASERVEAGVSEKVGRDRGARRGLAADVAGLGEAGPGSATADAGAQGRANPPGEPRLGGDASPYPQSSVLTETAFHAAVEKAKADLRGIVPRLTEQLREILSLRTELQVLAHPYDGLAAELDALLPPTFLRTTPYTQLPHFPRYLRAMKVRAERRRQNPAKDAERARLIAPYLAGAKKIAAQAFADPARAAAAEALRWLVEEFRVSVFAQELGTAEPVSAVKLDRAMAALQGGAASAAVSAKAAGPGAAAAAPAVAAGAPAAAPVPKPLPPTVMPTEKKKPVKSLGALGSLFQKP